MRNFLCLRFECERVTLFCSDFRHRCAATNANPFSNSWTCTHFLSSSFFLYGFFPEINFLQCFLWGFFFSTGRKQIGLVVEPQDRLRTLSTAARQDGFLPNWTLQHCLVSGEFPGVSFLSAFICRAHPAPSLTAVRRSPGPPPSVLLSPISFCWGTKSRVTPGGSVKLVEGLAAGA